MIRSILLALLMVLLSAPAEAGESAVAARAALESGRLDDGVKDFAARVAAHPEDNEARFGLGLLRFALAVQHFGERQFRYGLRAPRSAAPFLRMPVPLNAAPEEITYEKQRENLQGFVDDLAEVEATLAPMTSDSTAIVVDLNAVRLSIGGGQQTLGEIVATLTHGQKAEGPLEVKFDYADALWLRGYTHLLSGALEFVLGYDWRGDFELAGRLFYARVTPAPYPPGVLAPAGGGAPMLGDSGDIADLIVAIHEIRWPVVDAARLQRAHAHLKQTVALSRQSWKAILAETGDDREWIPGPRQTHPAIAGMAITQDQVDAWMSFLDYFDALLDGRKLLAHWRFNKGINLKRVFLEPRAFDLVLWVAGPGATPYLEDGPTVSSQEWWKWNAAFRQNFLGFAFYLN